MSHDVFDDRSGTVIGVAMTSSEPRAGFPLTLESKAVVILEVFSKKSEATPTTVLDNCRTRLAAYLKVAGGKKRR